MSCWIALSLTVPDPNVKYAYQIISEGIQLHSLTWNWLRKMTAVGSRCLVMCEVMCIEVRV